VPRAYFALQSGNGGDFRSLVPVIPAEGSFLRVWRAPVEQQSQQSTRNRPSKTERETSSDDRQDDARETRQGAGQWKT
jgi:hypothetical protein